MLSCWLGGIVFDAIRPNTTFELVAVFNLIVVIMALVLKKRIKVPVFAEDDGAPAPAH
jgi:hypothetical protein